MKQDFFDIRTSKMIASFVNSINRKGWKSNWYIWYSWI